ncbi:hypothetical protein KIN20_026639 [Parelaphostrongylus tenuis]|uniref:Uncharacterized protein n=1 Tax=Parelaphostrongylus tenuis TaxID=148309 RepID=A0AAD5QY70_PARTN|nr:hypothetical protein KIN20_026639 [Parelaphostrongylus tenuis]
MNVAQFEYGGVDCYRISLMLTTFIYEYCAVDIDQHIRDKAGSPNNNLSIDRAMNDSES